ncbi:MAG: MerC domain-containing protein [Sphingobium sp.]
MFQPITARWHWDRVAIGLSGLCVLHCIGTLLLLGLLSSLGEFLAAPIIHEAGLGLAIVFGAIAIGKGAMRHGRLLPVAIGSLGLGVMAGALTLGHGQEEAFYTISGVLILALGHYLNMRASQANKEGLILQPCC